MFLDKISDDLLICLYREGNQIAIDLLFERYNVFLYGFIHKMLMREPLYYEYKELFQELVIIFMSCIDRYDEDNGCFYYFVKKAAERKLIDIVNKNHRLQRIVSLDDFFYQGGVESCLDYVKEDDSVEYYETELYKSMEEKLGEMEMKIVDMRVEGFSYHEIAKLLAVSKQAVYRKVVAIKNIIKDIIEKID